MKTTIKLLLAAAVISGVASCSKEEPFDGKETTEFGKVSTASLKVALENENGVPDVYNRPTRAGAPDVNDFTVDFIKEGETEPAQSYVYSEMPEVVTLPVGKYTARASYGENAPAAWENPYFEGSSEQFDIVADEITDNVAPIVCRLSNVRVSIVFDPALQTKMSADSKVTVKVGDTGSLDFTAADSEKSGYFAYVEDSHTLAATFEGEVDGYATKETKAYDDVAPGKHYRITFRLHEAGDEDPGDISGDLSVDASVEVVDMNSEVDYDEPTVPDDMRPTEPGDEPDPGPGPDEPGETGPTVTGEGSIVFDQQIEVTSELQCKFNVHSETGVTALTVKIISDKLTPEELSTMGLAQNLDLVNPGECEEGLSGLGFPVKDQVAGQKDVHFDISQFMTMLMVLGSNETHKFEITATDASGSTTKTLILHVN